MIETVTDYPRLQTIPNDSWEDGFRIKPLRCTEKTGVVNIKEGVDPVSFITQDPKLAQAWGQIDQLKPPLPVQDQRDLLLAMIAGRHRSILEAVDNWPGLTARQIGDARNRVFGRGSGLRAVLAELDPANPLLKPAQQPENTATTISPYWRVQLGPTKDHQDPRVTTARTSLEAAAAAERQIPPEPRVLRPNIHPDWFQSALPSDEKLAGGNQPDQLTYHSSKPEQTQADPFALGAEGLAEMVYDKLGLEPKQGGRFAKTDQEVVADFLKRTFGLIPIRDFGSQGIPEYALRLPRSKGMSEEEKPKVVKVGRWCYTTQEQANKIFADRAKRSDRYLNF